MKWRDFWVPIMVTLGIIVVVMILIIFQQTNSFPEVDWGVINPQIVEFAPWIAILAVAFTVFLYLQRR